MAGGSTPYDVAVAGGGPAGATLARTLAGWGLRVVVCEASRGPRCKPGEVLGPTIHPILRRLGLAGSGWVARGIATPCRGICSIWGADDEAWRDDRRGFIIDRGGFEAHVADLAMAAGVEWRWGQHVQSAVRDGAAWRIETRAARAESGGAQPASEPVEILAGFLVDATGRRGALARRRGARRRIHDRLVAFALARPLDAEVSCSRGHVSLTPDYWLRVEASEDGWWYGVDTPDGWRRAVFITDVAALSPHSLDPVRELRLRLARTVAVGNWFHAVEGPVTALSAVDASSACLDAAAGPGWAAIGDAATSFDPIAGQGIPQAFASGLVAAHAIRSELSGHDGALEAYAAAAAATWLHSAAERAAVYATEMRWAGAPFWRRRLSPGSPGGRTSDNLPL